jgi:ABC-2 type transport system permease protein
MSLLRAWFALVLLSLRRLLWSSGTLMVVLPLAVCVIWLLRARYDRMAEKGIDAAFIAFSRDFVIGAYVSFIVPICALVFGTAGVGGDREDGTLLFLLIRPVPRALLLAAKFSATLPLTLCLVAAGFYIHCRLAGEAGRWAFELYLPALLGMTLAYVGLFQLFAVSIRHSTIAALVYGIFIELLLGNVPGIIKRVAISYFGRVLIYAAGAADGFDAPRGFETIGTTAAGSSLAAVAAGSLFLSFVVFQWREYRDLT